ncbi:MAG TPA: protein-disulfide reductase DsbD domain-containing protein [Burkholderiales bacterium]|nr:protein-disulfide reductase DsbD domain-containing protein [Burkholderiales bacterium]
MAQGHSGANVRFAEVLFVLVCALALGVSGSAAGDDAQKVLAHARLVAETTSFQRNQTAWLAVELSIEPGWHVYWRNPGDAGLATSVRWKLPDQVSVGPIVWPLPERFSARSIVGYGYRERVALLAAVKVPQGFAPKTLTVEAAVSWLACAEVCIPGGQTLKLTAPVGDSVPKRNAEAASLFAEARRQLPKPASFPVTFIMDNERIRLRFAKAVLAGVDRPSVAFYPFDSRLIEHSVPQMLALDGQYADLLLRRSPAAVEEISVLRGVLVVEGAGGGTAGVCAFEVFARRSEPVDPTRVR